MIEREVKVREIQFTGLTFAKPSNVTLERSNRSTGLANLADHSVTRFRVDQKECQTRLVRLTKMVSYGY